MENKGSKFSSAFPNIKESDVYAPVPEHLQKAIDSNKGVFTGKLPSSNNLIVNHRQRGNPLLKFIRNVPWEFGEIVPDYTMGESTCAMFLSLQYHNLNPNYIHERLKALGRQYQLRVLLVQIDLKDPHHTLQQLTKICLLADLTLMLAWNAEEAGTILQTYKAFEHKPADLIQARQDIGSRAQIVEALSSIRSLNRTDAATLIGNYGTMEKMVNTTKEELSLLPGIGQLKASKIYSLFNQPFLKEG